MKPAAYSANASLAIQCDQCTQLAEVGRLDQVVVETRLRGSLKMLLLAIPAMGNQQGVLLTRHRTYAASDLVAIHIGQAYIEQHHLRFELFNAEKRVRPVARGPSALLCVEQFKPEVVLLDIGLPDMDGYEVARRIRSMQRSA